MSELKHVEENLFKRSWLLNGPCVFIVCAQACVNTFFVCSFEQPDLNSNRIPEDERTVSKKNEVDEKELVSQNEVGVRSKAPSDDVDTNVLMASTSNESMFERTEVLAGNCCPFFQCSIFIYKKKKKM